MVKKHSEHKGPAPPPPPPPPPSSIIETVSNKEPDDLQLVSKVDDSTLEEETQLVTEPKLVEIPESKADKNPEINDSLNNNSEIEQQNFDTEENKNAISVQFRKHDIINPRPMSVAASINGPIVNTSEDVQIRARRRSSSASNRNQRRPSPPSLDKVLQMNQNIEKNKGKMPKAVMNELAGRLQNNQDETDQIQDKDNSK